MRTLPVNAQARFSVVLPRGAGSRSAFFLGGGDGAGQELANAAEGGSRGAKALPLAAMAAEELAQAQATR